MDRYYKRLFGAGISKYDFQAFKQEIERDHNSLVNSVGEFNPISVPMSTIDPDRSFFLEPQFQKFSEDVSWEKIEIQVLPMFLASGGALILARFIGWFFSKEEYLDLISFSKKIEDYGYCWAKEMYRSKKSWLRLSIKFFELFVPQYYDLNVRRMNSISDVTRAVPIKLLPVLLMKCPKEEQQLYYSDLYSIAIVGWTDTEYQVYDPYHHSENIQKVPFEQVNQNLCFGWVFSEKY